MALITCTKCDGEGIIRVYGHVKGGVCFKCEGSGVIHGRGASKAEREELKAQRAEMAAAKERQRAELQATRAREMAETGGLGPILFAAMQRQKQQSA